MWAYLCARGKSGTIRGLRGQRVGRRVKALIIGTVLTTSGRLVPMQLCFVAMHTNSTSLHEKYPGW